jgi:hypothetical protein
MKNEAKEDCCEFWGMQQGIADCANAREYAT